MTQIEKREADERRIIDALPALDGEAKDALYRAFCRSYTTSAEVRSKALAGVIRARVTASMPTAQPARRWWMVWKGWGW